MTTVLDVITRAHRKLGVSGQGEALSAEMAAEGLAALNDMMAGWRLQGINRLHIPLETGSEAFPMAPEFIEGVVYLLASRLGPNYEVPPSFDHSRFLRQLQTAFLSVEEVDMPTALTRLPSSRRSGWGPAY